MGSRAYKYYKSTPPFVINKKYKNKDKKKEMRKTVRNSIKTNKFNNT